jgi:hypothetical protein
MYIHTVEQNPAAQREWTATRMNHKSSKLKIQIRKNELMEMIKMTVTISLSLSRKWYKGFGNGRVLTFVMDT